MPDKITRGTIFIKESTLLPETLRFQSEACVPGWRLVKDLDGCGLDRKILENLLRVLKRTNSGSQRTE